MFDKIIKNLKFATIQMLIGVILVVTCTLSFAILFKLTIGFLVFEYSVLAGIVGMVFCLLFICEFISD